MDRAGDDDFEFAFDDADDLLVRVLMLGKRRPGIDLDPRVRLAIGMNEPGPQAGEDFTDRQLRDGNKRHPDTVHQTQNRRAGPQMTQMTQMG